MTVEIWKKMTRAGVRVTAEAQEAAWQDWQPDTGMTGLAGCLGRLKDGTEIVDTEKYDEHHPFNRVADAMLQKARKHFYVVHEAGQWIKIDNEPDEPEPGSLRDQMSKVMRVKGAVRVQTPMGMKTPKEAEYRRKYVEKRRKKNKQASKQRRMNRKKG